MLTIVDWNIDHTVKHGGGSIMIWSWLLCMRSWKQDYVDVLRKAIKESVGSLVLATRWVFKGSGCLIYSQQCSQGFVVDLSSYVLTRWWTKKCIWIHVNIKVQAWVQIWVCEGHSRLTSVTWNSSPKKTGRPQELPDVNQIYYQKCGPNSLQGVGWTQYLLLLTTTRRFTSYSWKKKPWRCPEVHGWKPSPNPQSRRWVNSHAPTRTIVRV